MQRADTSGSGRYIVKDEKDRSSLITNPLFMGGCFLGILLLLGLAAGCARAPAAADRAAETFAGATAPGKHGKRRHRRSGERVGVELARRSTDTFDSIESVGRI